MDLDLAGALCLDGSSFLSSEAEEFSFCEPAAHPNFVEVKGAKSTRFGFAFVDDSWCVTDDGGLSNNR
jgi:hypothetical protein